MSVYLDTSAALKLVVPEPESSALVEQLSRSRGTFVLVASRLLATELHCALRRRVAAAAVTDVERVLESVDLVELVRRDLDTALRTPGALRTNDAIHLATAIRLGVDAMLTYDAELADASRLVGIEVLAPV